MQKPITPVLPRPRRGVRAGGSAELARFYPTWAQREAVAAAAGHTRLVCADDDPYCPGRGAGAHWGEPLGLAVDLLPGAAHLNVEAGYGPWPAMRDWVLSGARAPLAQ